MSATVIDFGAYKTRRKIATWPTQPMPWAETPQEREAMLDAIRGDELTALRDWWNLRQRMT